MRVKMGGVEMTEAERQAVMEVMKSNQLSPGSKVRAFEGAFAYEHGAQHGVMVNSGTDALRIALGALKEFYGWKDGDQVIVPAITFVATVNVILQNGLVPLFEDVSMFDYGIDPRALYWNQKAKDAKCIMPVHMFGRPLRMEGKNKDPMTIMEQAKLRGWKVLEDSCECMGVQDMIGDIACYSTYVCHLISTGVGGIAITNNENLSDLMRSLANHGRSIDHIPGYRLSKDITKRFQFDRIGYSCRPTEFEAAIGLEQLKSLPDFILSRKKIADKITEGLDGLDADLRLHCGDGWENSSWMMYPIVVQKWAKFDKWRLCEFLEKNGIETREMMPLINQPCYKSLKINLADFPIANEINKNGFYIGCHPGMTDEDVKFVVETFHRFFDNKRKL